MNASVSMHSGELLIAVLAAGRSQRFGGDKLDSPCAGRPLGSWCLDAIACAGLPAGVIIARSESPRFAADHPAWCIETVAKSNAEMNHSLRLAVKAAIATSARVLMVSLADMPLIPPEHYVSIANADGDAATLYPDGRRGVPAKFSRSQFERLLAIDGDHGASQILAACDYLTVLDCDRRLLLDVDRPADLAKAERELADRSSSCL